MSNKAEKFWKRHSKILGNENYFSEEFKHLFISLIQEDAQLRPSIDEVLEHKWLNKSTISPQDVINQMTARKQNYLGRVQ